MPNIKDEFFAYKAATSGKSMEPDKADISSEFSNYKASVAKPLQELPQEAQFITLPGIDGEPPRTLSVTPEQVSKIATDLLPIGGAMAAGAAATPFLGGMGAIPAGLVAMGAAGAGAATGEAARQKIEGEEMSPKKMAVTGATYAAGEGLFQTIGIAANAAKNYIINSPRILDKIARILASVTKGEYTKSNILGALDRAGVPAAMKAIEAETEAVKFAPRGTGKLAAENVTTATKVGAEKMASVQRGLKEMRTLAGKEVDAVDNLLVETARAKGNNIIDLAPIAKEIDDTILAIETNPILSGAVNTTKLRTIGAKIAKNPNMAIDDAIKTKRMISDIFEDFGNKGVMAVRERDLLTETMSSVRVKLKEAIQKKADELGIKEFSRVYKDFGKFADDYDTELVPLFGSKEGAKFLEDRFISLSNEITRRGNVLENVQGSISTLFPSKNAQDVAKNISDLTDMLLIRSIYQDIGHAPSSELTGMIRAMVVSPTAQKFIKGANVSKSGKAISPTMPSKVAPGIVGAESILSPEQIKADYKSGKLDKATAAQMLRENHGFQ